MTDHVQVDGEEFQLDEAAQRSLDFAEGVLGAAGHKVTDPYLRKLLKLMAAGEISGDESRELARRYITEK